MDVSGVDAEDAVEMGDFEGVFGTLGVLFEIAGQASIAVGVSAEGGLDAPA